jgi:hypothetical protein
MESARKKIVRAIKRSRITINPVESELPKNTLNRKSVKAERRKSWNCEFLNIFTVLVLIYSLVIYANSNKTKAKLNKICFVLLIIILCKPRRKISYF